MYSFTYCNMSYYDLLYSTIIWIDADDMPLKLAHTVTTGAIITSKKFKRSCTSANKPHSMRQKNIIEIDRPVLNKKQYKYGTLHYFNYIIQRTYNS